MSKKTDFSAAVSGRIQQRAGAETLGPEREPSRFATPLADDALEIAIDHIRPNPDQPRKYFDEGELKELADSLRRDGVLQPISVRRTADSRIFEIESGERRWRASGLAGLRSIPCIVREGAFDPGTIRRRQISENIHRSDLKPIEAARSVVAYLKDLGFSQRAAAKDLSVSKTWIAELLSILTIPESLLDRLTERERSGTPLPKRALVALARIKDASEQQRVYEGMIVSGSPFAVAQEARARQHAQNRSPHFQRSMTHSDYHGYRLTVSVSEPPEQVDPRSVAGFLHATASDYTDEQAQTLEDRQSGP